MSAFSIDPGPLAVSFGDACRRLDELEFVDALWSRRPAIWSFLSDPADVPHHLGWLGAIDFVTPQIGRLRTFADSVARDGLTDVVLLGMGGSSLAPEVMRAVLGTASGFPRFHMVDTVDPDAVDSVFRDVSKTLFILASKSGTTIEPKALAAEAARRVRDIHHLEWPARVVAITDENTPLHRRALEEKFRDVFLNPADIGGRYSALSLFGLVPAALMGARLDVLLASAREMEAACRKPGAKDNPGVALGALIGAGARNGRDKLTLLLPEPLRAFGLWAEQLVAESTGKRGKGVVPIVSSGDGAHIGTDAVVVAMSVGSTKPNPSQIARVTDAGAPIATLHMNDVNELGAEFLRWEVATVAAGFLLEINPFDEPNVQQAKDATHALLDIYRQQRRLPISESHAAIEGMRITMSKAAEDQISSDPVGALVRLTRPHDYVGLLAYLPPRSEAFEAALADARVSVSDKIGCATVVEYGPRYLHSTGQLYKGGPNSGVFLVLTAEPNEDLPIPGEPFSFGVLEMAQALGDFQSLDKTERRAIHVHLPRRDPALVRRLVTALLDS